MARNGESHLIIVGSFENMTQAEQAIKALQAAGFQNEQIGFLVRNSADIVAGATSNPEAEMVTDTAGGAISGGILGGIVGAAVALLIPGVGPAIAGGILAATLGGVLVGATAGGIVGALTGMGVPQEEAEYYRSQFEAGRTIVTVNVDDRTQNPQQVRAILLQHGATDINVQPTHNAGNAPATSSVSKQERTYNSNIQPATSNQPQEQADEMREPGQ